MARSLFGFFHHCALVCSFCFCLCSALLYLINFFTLACLWTLHSGAAIFVALNFLRLVESLLFIAAAVVLLSNGVSAFHRFTRLTAGSPAAFRATGLDFEPVSRAALLLLFLGLITGVCFILRGWFFLLFIFLDRSPPINAPILCFIIGLSFFFSLHDRLFLLRIASLSQSHFYGH